MSGKKKTSTTNTTDLQTLKIGSRVRCTDDGVEGRITWASGTHVKIKWDDGEQVTWKRDSLATRSIEILDTAGEEYQPAPLTEETTAEQATPTSVPQAEPEPAPAAPEPPAAEEAVEPTATEPATPPAKPKRQQKPPAEPKEKKVSALDAAVKVLGEAGQPMTCQEMIEAMAAKGYWTSPGGQTPAATLYSAILRELGKGPKARFVKTDRGKFARKGAE
jgi:hypothetical protein